MLVASAIISVVVGSTVIETAVSNEVSGVETAVVDTGVCCGRPIDCVASPSKLEVSGSLDINADVTTASV